MNTLKTVVLRVLSFNCPQSPIPVMCWSLVGFFLLIDPKALFHFFNFFCIPKYHRSLVDALFEPSKEALKEQEPFPGSPKPQTPKPPHAPLRDPLGDEGPPRALSRKRRRTCALPWRFGRDALLWGF